MRTNWSILALAGATILGLSGVSMMATGQPAPAPGASAPSASAPGGPPKYKYDSSWPKELPNKWTFEGITGMYVDKNDVIWVLNRPRDFDEKENAAAVVPPAGECCVAPPAVMAFNPAGDLLHAWGVPNSVPGWPKSEHTIFTDRAGNVYIGGAQAGDSLLKFTHDGKLISDFGHRGPAVAGNTQKQDNQQTDLLLRGVAAATLDEDAHEVYIADGYLNRRVLVYDWDTGKFKRGWGAYGIALREIANPLEPTGDAASAVGRYVREGPDYVPGEPPEKQFRTPVHCVHLSAQGYVFVCDRRNDRIQVFTKQGKFLKEFLVHRETQGNGSVWMLNFSRLPQQKYLLVADGINQRIWVLRRKDGVEVSNFGAGYLHSVHQGGLDSKGSYYIGDVGGDGGREGGLGTGKSIQKFVLQNGRSGQAAPK